MEFCNGKIVCLETVLTLKAAYNRTEQLQRIFSTVTVLPENEIIFPPDSSGLIYKCASFITVFHVTWQFSRRLHCSLNFRVGKDCRVKMI